jgi:hypothetical protein
MVLRSKSILNYDDLLLSLEFGYILELEASLLDNFDPKSFSGSLGIISST